MLTRIRTAAEEKDEGFTLIELLVVIIIIGILAAIAIPVFLSQRKKAIESGMKSDLHTVANEMDSFYVDNQTYPAVTSGTGTVDVGGTSVHLSKGNVVSAMTGDGVATGTYCLRIYNDATGGIASAVYFDSDHGGIQPDGDACA